MPRLFLIDTFGYLFRAFHARARTGAPPMLRKRGLLLPRRLEIQLLRRPPAYGKDAIYFYTEQKVIMSGWF